MSTVISFPEATPLTLRVADEVRALMGRHRVSQTTLAEVLHVTQTQISRRLRGQITFDVNEIGTLAEFFGVSPAVLLGLAAPTSGGPDGGSFGHTPGYATNLTLLAA